jgi:hypothetical protein
MLIMDVIEVVLPVAAPQPSDLSLRIMGPAQAWIADTS